MEDLKDLVSDDIRMKRLSNVGSAISGVLIGGGVFLLNLYRFFLRQNTYNTVLDVR